MLTDVLWLVGGIVAVMMGLSVLVLGGPDTSGWTFGGWMDGLRTAATAGGLVVAVLVYRNWRTQERAKRDASVAADLLVAAYKAANATRALRRVGWTHRSRITKAELRMFVTSYEADDVRRARELVDEVRGRLASTRIVFGKSAASALAVIPQMFQQVMNAKKDLDFLSFNRNKLSGISDESDEADEEWQMQGRKAMEVLGATSVTSGATLAGVLLNWQNDEGEKKITASLSELEKHLERFVRLAAE